MADLPQWHVLGPQITQETQLGPGSTGLRSVYVIPYMVDSGPAKGSIHKVEVDPRDFNEATVARLIEAGLNDVHRVAGLGSPGV